MEFITPFQFDGKTIRIGNRIRYPVDRVQRIIVKRGSGTRWHLLGLASLLVLFGFMGAGAGLRILYLLPGAMYFLWRAERENRKIVIGLELKKRNYGRESEFVPLLKLSEDEKAERELSNLLRKFEKRGLPSIRVVRRR